MQYQQEDGTAVHGEPLMARLERGSLADWAVLVQAIDADPDGPVASGVLDICRTYPFRVSSSAHLLKLLVMNLRSTAGIFAPLVAPQHDVICI